MFKAWMNTIQESLANSGFPFVSSFAEHGNYFHVSDVFVDTQKKPASSYQRIHINKWRGQGSDDEFNLVQILITSSISVRLILALYSYTRLCLQSEIFISGSPTRILCSLWLCRVLTATAAQLIPNSLKAFGITYSSCDNHGFWGGGGVLTPQMALDFSTCTECH
jgi:hypothetical protein